MPHSLRPILLLVFLAIGPRMMGGVMEDARALFKESRYPEARTGFEQAYQADPKNSEATYYLGRLAVLHDDALNGIPYLEKAVALVPTSSDYYYWLGNAYGAATLKAGFFKRVGLAKKCLQAYQKAISIDPDNLDARMNLLSFYRQAPGFIGGNMDKAYAEAVEIRKRSPIWGGLALADLAIGEKKYSQAFSYYETVLEKQPDHYRALYLYGRLAAQTGQNLERGGIHLQHCLELTPPASEVPHATILWRLGTIAEKQNNFPAARSSYETALKIDSNLKQVSEALARIK